MWRQSWSLTSHIIGISPLLTCILICPNNIKNCLHIENHIFGPYMTTKVIDTLLIFDKKIEQPTKQLPNMRKFYHLLNAVMTLGLMVVVAVPTFVHGPCYQQARG